MSGIRLALHALAVSLAMCRTVNGSHSFLVFATYIKGDTPFPEFGAAMMLDDIQLAYYSSNENRFFARGPLSAHEASEGTSYGGYVFTYMSDYIKFKTVQYINHHNNTHDTTHGIYSHQSVFGCDSATGKMSYKESLNGNTGDEIYVSVSDNTFQTVFKWPEAWTILNSYWRSVIVGTFKPVCTNVLNELLRRKWKHVLRKVKPRVRLFQKDLRDSAGAKITCLATGFYPRHINLTLLRDGQSVSDHQLIGGELLPNADGTYQMRKSLEVSAEELRQKHQYSCKAEHLSMDNKLDITVGDVPGRSYLAPAAVVVFACLTAGIIAIRFYRRRHMGPKDVPRKATAVPVDPI